MIEAGGLTKRYRATAAVQDLSFTIAPGQVTGFPGPNGAGKSTTMRLILGLDAPDAGSVTVGGRPYVSYRRPLFQAGALLEAKAFHSGRTAYNHLLCLALSHGISRARVEKVLDLAGLAGAARRRAGGFSLGMSQRLGIAAALLGDPPVLMLDEPVNGLDPEGVAWIRTLLKSLAAEGRTVLLSSHLMSEMALTADQLIIIGRGRLIIQATMEDFLAGGSGSYIRVRSPQAAELAAPLTARGATVARRDGDALTVTGISTEAIGEVAVASRLTRPRAARIRSRRHRPLQRRRGRRPARRPVRTLPARGAAAAILAGHHRPLPSAERRRVRLHRPAPAPGPCLQPWAGLGVFCIYPAATLAAGFVLISRRDV